MKLLDANLTFSSRKLRAVSRRDSIRLKSQFQRGILGGGFYVCRFKRRPRFVPAFIWFYLLHFFIEIHE